MSDDSVRKPISALGFISSVLRRTGICGRGLRPLRADFAKAVLAATADSRLEAAPTKADTLLIFAFFAKASPGKTFSSSA
jgi:hypothetical protein